MITNPVIPDFPIGTLISNLVSMAIIIAGLLTLLYLVWGGIEWITSAGDKGGLESARNRITNALVGLTIVVASWAIMQIITNFLGFPFPTIPIPMLGNTTYTSCYENCMKTSTNTTDCYIQCRKTVPGR